MSEPRDFYFPLGGLTYVYTTEEEIVDAKANGTKLVHVIEKSAYDKLKAERDELAETLRRVLKESFAHLDFSKCEGEGHYWQPNLSLTIFRCDKCGVGAKAWAAKLKLEGVSK